MDKISVVVPVYKVEKTLRKCVDSILKQTYKNIEVILVNDGSPDQCGAICDEYLKKDDRVKVIHKSNGGLSDARNVGIKIATGKYIGFVDSDDYITEDMYESLYNNIQLYNADIAICGVYNMSLNLIEDTIKEEILFSKREALEELFKNQRIQSFAWNKLYKIELFNDISYPFGKRYEDIFTTYRLFYKSEKIIYSSKKKYVYNNNPESITSQSFSLKDLDLLEAGKELMEFSQKYYTDISHYQVETFVKYNTAILRKMIKSNYIDYEILYSIVGDIKKYLKIYLKSNYDTGSKLFAIIACFNIKFLVIFYKNLLKIGVG